MAAPTFVQEVETVFNTTTSPKTTASFSVTTGDVIVAWACLEGSSGDNTITIANSGTAFTWTLQEDIDIIDYPTIMIWTTTASATQSNTVTFTKTAGGASLFWGGGVSSFSASAGVGAAEKTNVSSGAPTLNITTTAANSAIVTVNADWNATDGASRTWRTVNGITPTAGNALERTYFRDAARYTLYAAYYNDAGATGVKAVGLSAPGSQKYSIVAVEVKGVGGTLFTATVAGAVTPAGGLVKKVNKVFSGATTPVGIVVKRVSKAFAGAVTPVGSLIKRVGKVFSGAVTPVGALSIALRKAVTLAGSITPVGSVVKRVNKVLQGSVVPTGSLVKVVGKVFSGLVTPVGTVVKVINKVFSGSLSLVGTLSSVFISGGGIIYQVTLDAALALSGSLSKQVNKVFSGVVTPVGVVRKVVSKVFSGIVTPIGTLISARKINIILSGVITPVGVIVKRVNKVFSGSITPVGSLVVNYIRSITLSGAVSMVGTLTVSFISGSVAVVSTMLPWFRRKGRR